MVVGNIIEPHRDDALDVYDPVVARTPSRAASDYLGLRRLRDPGNFKNREPGGPPAR